MLALSSSTRSLSLSSTRRAAPAGSACSGGIVVASSSTLLSSTSPMPLSSQQPSRAQLRSLAASPRRAPVAARAFRSEGSSHAGVTARWCLDARFGSKAEAAALLAEWATKIAPRALREAAGGGGANSSPSVRVLSGAIGASESRLEVEVSGLPSLAALELLWESLPREENREWQERLARHVVDGSTQWEVFYELRVGGVGGGSSGSREEERKPSTSFASTTKAAAAAPPSSSSSASASPLLVVSGDEAAAILQADAAAARAAIEKSSANGNGSGGAAANGSLSSSSPSSSSAGRGRPRSLERATAARARAAAEAAKHEKASSSRSLSSSSSSPPPIKISSILGAAAKSNGNGFGGESSTGTGTGNDNTNLDASKLVPGQRLPDGSVVSTDWKGDVMIIRPGDRGIAGL